jgi:hypothetical protein
MTMTKAENKPRLLRATFTALAANESGVVTVRNIVLISSEDMDRASKKGVDHRLTKRILARNAADCASTEWAPVCR